MPRGNLDQVLKLFQLFGPGADTSQQIAETQLAGLQQDQAFRSSTEDVRRRALEAGVQEQLGSTSTRERRTVLEEGRAPGANRFVDVQADATVANQQRADDLHPLNIEAIIAQQSLNDLQRSELEKAGPLEREFREGQIDAQPAQRQAVLAGIVNLLSNVEQGNRYDGNDFANQLLQFFFENSGLQMPQSTGANLGGAATGLEGLPPEILEFIQAQQPPR